MTCHVWDMKRRQCFFICFLCTGWKKAHRKRLGSCNLHMSMGHSICDGTVSVTFLNLYKKVFQSLNGYAVTILFYNIYGCFCILFCMTFLVKRLAKPSWSIAVVYSLCWSHILKNAFKVLWLIVLYVFLMLHGFWQMLKPMSHWLCVKLGFLSPIFYLLYLCL